MSHDHFDELATDRFNKSVAGTEIFTAIVEPLAIFRAHEFGNGAILKIAHGLDLDNLGRLTLGLPLRRVSETSQDRRIESDATAL